MEQKERIRTNVPITGIDTTTPDHTVADGKCEELHNLRFTGGAWRNVRKLEAHNLGVIDNYEIIYKHPITPKDEYIIKAKTSVNQEISHRYAYTSNGELYYTLSPINALPINSPIYDANMERVGFLDEYSGSDDLYDDIIVNSAPSPNTFIIKGFGVESRDDLNAPNCLYFAEGKPIVGGAALYYESGAFHKYGIVEYYDDREIHLKEIYSPDAPPSNIYAYKIRREAQVNVLNNNPTMWRIECDKAVLYTPHNDFGYFISSIVFVEDKGELRLAVAHSVVDGGSWTKLQYILLDHYSGEIKTVYYDTAIGSKKEEVHWLMELTLERYPSADKIYEEKTTSICSAIISKDSSEIKQEICKAMDDAEVSHFGNMLLISSPKLQSLDYYLLDGDKYRPYADAKALGISFTISKDKFKAPDSAKWKLEKPISDEYFIRIWEKIADSQDASTPLSSTQEIYWRGEFAVFAALRSRNGSILYRSPIQIYRSADGQDLMPVSGDTVSGAMKDETKGKVGLYYNVEISKDTYDLLKDNPMDMDVDKVARNFVSEAGKFITTTISFDANLESEDIYDVAFYATRLYTLFNGSKINDIDLMQEPFYLLHSLTKSTIKLDSTSSFIVDAAMLNRVEHQPLYVATQSSALYSNNIVEYNNRLHLLGVDVSFKPFVKNTLTTTDAVIGDNGLLSCAILQRQYNNRELASVVSATNFRDQANNSFSYALSQPSLLSFDGEIKNLYIGNTNLEYSNKFILKYSPSLDMSYYTNKASSNGQKYAPIELAKNKIDKLDASILDNTTISNRMQVSEVNDPYTFPYNTSYRIGSATNEIITANSAAIEMSDAKFGEFPLYVFTKEGIFAMQSGTETLYSAIIPINYDVAINPNTLAVNGAVLYFTDKGLHALSNQGAVLLSEPIHTADNRIPDWMYTSQMIYLPEWNEVLCTDLPNKKAYVFSLDSKVWSTRDIPSGYILNNNELVSEEDSKIYDLRNEAESMGADKINCTLTTRPIKLGANKELKRLETLVVRFEADKDEELEVTIKGSIDGVKYKDLRKVSATTNTDVLIRRTPASVKYLKFVVKGSNLQSSIRLIRFDTEHYLRFVRKMR